MPYMQAGYVMMTLPFSQSFTILTEILRVVVGYKSVIASTRSQQFNKSSVMSGEEEEEELCEYERRRLAHIRENRDLMRTLGEWGNILCLFVYVDTYILLSFSFVAKAFVARALIKFLFSSVFVFFQPNI